MADKRYFMQPSVVNDLAIYVLDRTIPCDCEGDTHNPTPGQGDCAKVLHVLTDSRAARAYVSRLNAEEIR